MHVSKIVIIPLLANTTCCSLVPIWRQVKIHTLDFTELFPAVPAETYTYVKVSFLKYYK